MKNYNSKFRVKRKKINSKLKIAIVRSNYYPDLAQSLEKACYEHLITSGVLEENIKTYKVSGSWEIPLIVKKVLEKNHFDGIVALGVIIKGETYHFELIASEVTRSLMELSLKTNTPIAFEILATFNLKQAKDRALGENNKGIEAALTILEMINTIKKI